MIVYKTLEETQLSSLYTAFSEAFAEYYVDIKLSFERFQTMLLRRGVDLRYSIGAFHQDMMVGFIICGIRRWKSALTGYDIGTGIIPEYQRQGISTEIMNRLFELLAANQINNFMLEVIKANKPALELYLKSGFEVSRSFSCYRRPQMDSPSAFAAKTAILESDLENLKWDTLTQFWDYLPSWQNSIDSLLATPTSFACIQAQSDHQTIGYGIIERVTGDIPQLAVQKDHRQRGVGMLIINELAKKSSSNKITCLNVDEQARMTNNFLIHRGFQHYADQFEMIRKLQ
ncbi:GNAT family N-acetyltransferase [candidate division CSSED10-310 bacterium]|uniref:GNAT family N-acetyltransferase n=1 Tax=candidate division CSSED10-310 bacterium TaxID=2855610 RepID=A0ABV6Z5M0_UNCC1